MAEAMYETEMFGIETPSESTFTTATAPTNTTSTAPYSSEGPTLPILGGAGEHSIHRAAGPSAAIKRAQPAHDAEQADEQTQPNANKKQKTAELKTSPSSKPKISPTPHSPNPELDHLRKPYLLLPPTLLEAIYKRLGEGWWEENGVPVVMTRNQNIRSGVNKLKSYLGVAGPSGSGDLPEGIARVLGSEKLVIAVSAMGEGTTKLVGVLEVLRRVVGSADNEKEGEEWWLYTSLGSRAVERRDRRGGKHGRDGDGVVVAQRSGVELGDRADDEEGDASFEPAASSREMGGGASKVRNVPVLTVWLSRTSILEFKREFGEERFVVGKT